MRLLFVIGLVLATVLVVEGGKHHHGKHEKLSLKAYKLHEKPTAKSYHHGGTKHEKLGRLRGTLREGGLKSVHDDWLSIPKHSKCVKTTCGHKEFCLANPKTGEEKCLSKRRFREGRKLFKKFHHEKKQLLRELHTSRNHGDKTKHLHPVEAKLKGVHERRMEKRLRMAEHMKDVHEMLGEYKKHGHKDLDIKSMMKKTTDLVSIPEAGDKDVCKLQELYELKKRMVGWFVLLHTESRQRKHHLRKKMHHSLRGIEHQHVAAFSKVESNDKKHAKKHADKLEAKRTRRSVNDGMTIQTESHHNCHCSKSVMWDFHKKDADSDGFLSHEELARLEHLKREPCMAPMFKSCDLDSDGRLSHGEWCCCMAFTVPPCAEKRRLAGSDDWKPVCDKEGYYHREQCDTHGIHCWCVDINGNTIPDSKQLGSGHCGKYDPNGQLIKM